ncbi:hypothetical protein CC1G_15229 [Coprinopsis cinerea okayama7|uniref:Uncharacterized protein n=1 Tax=Coprinopsis cinerea (strain Okayama-7 / 130 / ATCC MYA-4618 / FGSC 9003) TaxID=240176 RepID=D6RPU6_COPC7|nr:hypothetical protein CC1G_15229 [Coprinopsis cinerea okayama7\|eukprot:XP_002910593.1 hypothetical protein CC1G_15229 [Coprinopsis cinerea okayama7\
MSTYLHAIGGTTTCAVPSGGSRFCHSVSPYGHNVTWHGAVNGVSYAQSNCANVADGGVLWVLNINNCKFLNPWFPHWHFMEAQMLPWGNENLIVTIRNNPSMYFKNAHRYSSSRRPDSYYCTYLLPRVYVVNPIRILQLPASMASVKVGMPFENCVDLSGCPDANFVR